MDFINEGPDLTNIETLSAEYRGIIIEGMINIEEYMEYILLRYYFGDDPDKHNAFRHSILSKEQFNFMLKYTALSFIFKAYCKPFLIKHPSFLAELKKLIELRNIVAHRKFNEALSSLAKREIVFSHNTTDKGKISIKNEIMNPEKLNAFLIKYNQLYDEIKEIDIELFNALRDVANQRIAVRSNIP